jgi:hypothetical protein
MRVVLDFLEDYFQARLRFGFMPSGARTSAVGAGDVGAVGAAGCVSGAAGAGAGAR